MYKLLKEAYLNDMWNCATHAFRVWSCNFAMCRPTHWDHWGILVEEYLHDLWHTKQISDRATSDAPRVCFCARFSFPSVLPWSCKQDEIWSCLSAEHGRISGMHRAGIANFSATIPYNLLIGHVRNQNQWGVWPQLHVTLTCGERIWELGTLSYTKQKQSWQRNEPLISSIHPRLTPTFPPLVLFVEDKNRK